MRNILILAAMSIAAGCSSSKPGSDDGFVSIFDGKSFAGWHSYNRTGVGKAWKIENGCIRLDASNKAGWQATDGGDIVTDEAYENFHLQLEWKVAPKGNSGIIFYVQESADYKHTWMTGPEMQVLDNNGHPDAKIYKHRAGDLYDMIACSQETVKPAGEWNKAEIIANKGTLEFRLNDVSVVKTSYGDEAWRQLIAGSKFKSMPGFGSFSKGKIALQDHGDDVWFRNIRIRKL
ncbi:MAG: DUF1080 domain-containing protein [Chitinophagaceae bacterium]|nr:DUF1080 domain-containing protein [Chitinophagaceae bacterium]